MALRQGLHEALKSKGLRPAPYFQLDAIGRRLHEALKSKGLRLLLENQSVHLTPFARSPEVKGIETTADTGGIALRSEFARSPEVKGIETPAA